jgi:hypothetical protein
MSLDRSREAERVLMRVRMSADPAPDVERRVLASVEQRIVFEGDVTRTGAADVTAGAAALLPGAARSSGASMLSGALRWRQVSRVAARLGRWATFGLVAGAIGYHFGWMARDRATSPAVASTAAAGASTTTDASRTAASPGEPTQAEPAPREPISVEPAPAEAPSAPPPSPADIGATPPKLAPSAGVAESVRRAATGRPRSRMGERRESPAAKPGAPPRPLTLAELLERLLRAQTSLRGRDPHAALEELDALDALDTGSSRALTEERLVLRALAFCDIGRLSDARRVLSELDRLGAESIYRGRLEQACPAALTP